MSQKINPHGARTHLIFNWRAKWYAKRKDFASNLYTYKLCGKIKDSIKTLGNNLCLVDVGNLSVHDEFIQYNLQILKILS